MAVKRLFLLVMLVACSARAADFGDIPASLALPAGTSVRRNAGNTGFESYTPGSGGSGTFIGLDFTGATWQFVNGSGIWTDATSNDNFLLGVLAGAQLVTPGTTNTGFGFKAFETTQTIGQGNTGVGQKVFETRSAVGSFNTLVGSLAHLSDENISNAVGIGENVAVGDTSIAVGGVAEAGGVGSITIGYFLTASDDDQISIGGVVDPATAGFVQSHTATLGSATTTDAFFGDTAQSNIHGNTLYLNPTPTPSPVEGRFTAGANHHSYYYNGTIWKQLDNDTPTPTPTATPTATATSTATATATATATPTPTPSATATAFPQGFTAHFSRGGAAIQVNDVTITPWTTKYPGTITGFIISADQGTCTLKVWKRATGTAIPTIADVINTSGVSLATGTHIDSTTVTDFTTTTVSVGDQFMAQVTAVSGGATDITFQIPIRQ